MKKIILALAAACMTAAFSHLGFAEGALAVGIPQGDPNKGFRWSIQINNPDSASSAMKDCRAARNPATGKACMLIGTFSDQCVAVAANADGSDPVTGAGWAIAPDSATATKRAIDQCNASRNGTGRPCQLDGEKSMLCDGSAK